MNNNNRPSRGYPSYHSPYQSSSTANKPQLPPTDDRISGRLILIEVLLLLCAAAAAAMILSSLGTEYRISYKHPSIPVLAIQSAQAEPLSGIPLSEIPEKTPVTIDIPDEPDEPDEPDIPFGDTIPLYDWTSPVPEGDVYDYSHFENAVFIGDSRMAGLILYTRLSPYNFSATGVNVTQMRTRQYIRMRGDDGEFINVTCCEALESMKGDYDSIYISVGINELGWNSSSFIKELKAFIEDVRAIDEVPIYVQLILPVTTEHSETSQFGITNEKAVEFNDKIRKLAEEEQVFLLDPTELFALEDGSLDPERSFDGVHLQVEACVALAEYYMNHVVDMSNYQSEE